SLSITGRPSPASARGRRRPEAPRPRVHPPTELGRRFRDALGRVNAIWGGHAEEVLLVVAGRALKLEKVDP
ncbi:MAG TPA: bifunctional adenosylcobinamide kinase/adenosylcobinamide-phosphate guanylyltransferase, partial [Actinomycetota bacterium]|nr:bifunctional adenosylcobinamide kinase/adenosylcobinamide-phosphate guanylyltransferase [Actinomycetota bacterium]